MPIFVWVIIISCITGVGGIFLGGLLGSFVKKDSTKLFSLLLCFASGVMLAMVCFDLIPDALEYNDESKSTIFLVVAFLLIGYSTVAIINALVDKWSENKKSKLGENAKKTSDLYFAGIVMAIALAIHNLPEGVVIGATFAKSLDTVAKEGIIVSLIIMMHNIPAGIAIAMPMISAGSSKIKAMLVCALSGAPTIVGSLIGFFVGTISPIWLCISLSFASGAMLFVVFGDLLPEGLETWKSKVPSFAILIGLLVGMFLIFIG